MMDWAWLDRRPVVGALAGPNGAGKTTFFHAHLAAAGLRFVNADVLAAELDLPAYGWSPSWITANSSIRTRRHRTG